MKYYELLADKTNHGKYAVIMNGEIVDVYDTSEAAEESIKKSKTTLGSEREGIDVYINRKITPIIFAKINTITT